MKSYSSREVIQMLTVSGWYDYLLPLKGSAYSFLLKLSSI